MGADLSAVRQLHLVLSQSSRHIFKPRPENSYNPTQATLPQGRKKPPNAGLYRKKNNQNCHSCETRWAYFHPEKHSYCYSLNWSSPQEVQENCYLGKHIRSKNQLSVLAKTLNPSNMKLRKHLCLQQVLRHSLRRPGENFEPD